MKPSILRNLLISSVFFGLVTGAVFPFFAEIFVDIKEGMFVWFQAACLLAGTLIGISNYWLVNVILLKRLKRISEIANAISQNDVSHECKMQSNDLIGEKKPPLSPTKPVVECNSSRPRSTVLPRRWMK